MICQSCGKKQATTHIKAVVNGKLTQFHLCDDCAREKGYHDLFGGWDLGFGGLLSGLFGSNTQGEDILRCEKCGSTFGEIAKTGKVGCSECYHTFRRQLLPVIQRIHGAANHKGKTPRSSALRVTEQNSQIMPVQESPLEEKKRLLKKAVEEQEFEQAAVLRDEIKELENHG